MNQGADRTDLLWKYVDGQCTEAERHQVEAWMNEDAAFAEEVQFMMGLEKYTKQEMTVSAPTGFTKQLMKQLRPKFSWIPFATQTISSRNIIPWALGLSLLVVTAFLSASQWDQVVQTEQFTTVENALPSSSWVVGGFVCLAFFFLLDRILYFFHLKQEAKDYLNA
ncbi:MAG: hypothetical protein KTR13_10670 [Saprospiraceae bacterium]|nr:hypothetical protein [Saprospiraceae bacterium]